MAPKPTSSLSITTLLESRLPEIIAALPDDVKDELREGAEAIAEDAQSRVPVSTGRLRDAIHVEEADDGWIVVAGDDVAFYGHIVEHGSTTAPPHPFLLPAGEAQREAIISAVAQALGDL